MSYYYILPISQKQDTNSIRIKVTGVKVYPNEFNAIPAPGNNLVLEKGNYSVVVVEDPFRISNSTFTSIKNLTPDCNGNIQNGEGKLCVITIMNSSKQDTANLVLVERIIGSTNSEDKDSLFNKFNVSVVGNCIEANCNWTKSNEYNDSFRYSISQYHLLDGPFKITVNSSIPLQESTMLNKYNTSVYGSCSGEIKIGDLKTCFITYYLHPTKSDKSATLKIKHQIINDNGGP